MFDGIFINGLNGLQVQEQRLAAISDNIANAQTVGYKRTDVRFASLLNDTATAAPILQTSSVKAQSYRSPMVQGEIFTNENETNSAIQGKGYFIVNTQSDGSGDFYYTRDGTFAPNASGIFVNASGYYLMGFSTTTATFTETVRQAALTNTASALSSLVAVTAPPGTVLQAAAATSTATASGTLPPVASQAVGRTFTSSMGVYDGNENAHEVILTYTVTATGYTLSASSADGTITSSSGASTITAGSTTPITLTATWTTPQAATSSIALDISGLNHATATFDARAVATNGNVRGQLSSIEITTDGLINAKLTNNNVVTVGQIAVASFRSEENLEEITGTSYVRTDESGAPTITACNSTTSGSGSVLGSALERSNVDLANELATLIIVQRAYSFNSTVLQTADQMTRTATELKR